MDISCHSFVRMAKLAAPLMSEGGAMFAMSYHGAERVVPNYNVMGPVKAALEAACRYLAHELGPKHIRVHAISPGPLQTRAASGLKDFDLLLSDAIKRAPVGELVPIQVTQSGDVPEEVRMDDEPAAHLQAVRDLNAQALRALRLRAVLHRKFARPICLGSHRSRCCHLST